jgi:hypothetical protein
VWDFPLAEDTGEEPEQGEDPAEDAGEEM